MSATLAPVTVTALRSYINPAFSFLARMPVRPVVRPPVRVRKPIRVPRTAPLQEQRTDEQQRRTDEYFKRQADAYLFKDEVTPRSGFKAKYGISLPELDLSPLTLTQTKPAAIRATPGAPRTALLEPVTVTAPRYRTSKLPTQTALAHQFPDPQTPSLKPQRLARPKAKTVRGTIDLEPLTRTRTTGVDFAPEFSRAISRRPASPKTKEDACAEKPKRDRKQCPARGYRMVCKEWSKIQCL